MYVTRKRILNIYLFKKRNRYSCTLFENVIRIRIPVLVILKYFKIYIYIYYILYLFYYRYTYSRRRRIRTTASDTTISVHHIRLQTSTPPTDDHLPKVLQQPTVVQQLHPVCNETPKDPFPPPMSAPRLPLPSPFCV
jgi:hypothetical protein